MLPTVADQHTSCDEQIHDRKGMTTDRQWGSDSYRSVCLQSYHSYNFYSSRSSKIIIKLLPKHYNINEKLMFIYLNFKKLHKAFTSKILLPFLGFRHKHSRPLYDTSLNWAVLQSFIHNNHVVSVQLQCIYNTDRFMQHGVEENLCWTGRNNIQ